MIGVAFGTNSKLSVGTISDVGVAVGSRTGGGSSDVPGIPDGKNVVSSKIGAPVVGLLVGLFDGPIVHVGDSDWVLLSSILEEAFDGAGEAIGGSIGGRVVGPLVGTLDGEEDHEGLYVARLTSGTERGPSLGASERSL